ncbi:uncharacterized Nudix hydrolase NudL isoform X2 [Ischnura elegans]|uniref:uncharacterized Nudix hydrolase NudL isoform X2 n=1 Tax=Ischnura elegans TaxID=197161 RepID=UPI001ED8A58D|nr:uncharacterized Nudix hydrolase NudL isoform X2 [Ischnura elegans]
MIIGSALMARIIGASYRIVKVCAKEMHKLSSDITLESVINQNNREKCVSRLQKMPAIRLKPGEVPRRQAAVLVPICVANGRVSLLYTLRSSSMRKNASQVSFPGGMRDDTDRDLVHTALRETEEELGIPQDSVDVWCTANFIDPCAPPPPQKNILDPL